MSDRRRRAKLNDIAQIASALREPVETPDFTTSILERVHAEKPFASAQTRRWVPVVRIGAVCVTLLTVFVMTLIVFVKPDLPEKLGAPVSVTTELVQSTEEGIVTRVAALRESVETISRGADIRVILSRHTSEAPVAGTTLRTAYEPIPPAPLNVMPERARFADASVPAAFPLAAAAVPEPLAGDLADYADFVRGTLIDASYPAADMRAGAAPWQRAAIASQPWRGRPMPFVPVFAGSHPRLNPDAPPLVQELFPLITGQPVGEELQIR